MSSNFVRVTTSTAPVNIAVVKYWGKRDEHLILPINDSLSLTLNSDEMHAKTSAATGPGLKSDRLWLNGKEESVEGNQRLVNCLKEVRRLAKEQGKDCSDWSVHVCSENNFPTAAGLASSAAGYACLVHALCSLFDLDCDLSVLARRGSGSACRSVHGGFVEWRMGGREDGQDSVARQLWPASHWPEMRVLILVASDARKKVPSSRGMKLSVETSELLRHRREKIVPERMRQMKKAIEERDFESFADLTMRDSNQLHAVCLDTTPPCVYMNDVSHSAQDLVHAINQRAGKKVVCYTFDAGPNACLFLLVENLAMVASSVLRFFPPAQGQDASSYLRGPKIDVPEAQPTLADLDLPVQPGALKYVIHTTVGSGPATLATTTSEDASSSSSAHLLETSGECLPK